jgi:hypothetical protein
MSLLPQNHAFLISPNLRIVLVGLALVVYSAGFFAFYPNAITNTDEACYIRQAAAFSRGEVRVPSVHPVAGSPTEEVVSWYPPGLSALMTPAVKLWGWRGAFAVSWLSVIAVVLINGASCKTSRLPPMKSHREPEESVEQTACRLFSAGTSSASGFPA